MILVFKDFNFEFSLNPFNEDDTINDKSKLLLSIDDNSELDEYLDESKRFGDRNAFAKSG